MMRWTLVAVVGLMLVSAIYAQQAAPAKNADGALVLFNGKDLSGWEGDKRFWSVEDGAITGLTTAEKKAERNTFLIYRGGSFKDFELRVKFRLENHNSGIQYRSKDRGNFVVNGYQGDMDGANTYTGMLYEEGGRGILATPGIKLTIGPDGKPADRQTITDPAKVKQVIKNKDWNEFVITCRGNHILHQINGVTTAEAIDNDPKGRSMEGIIALQLHQGPPMKVQFKDITIKVLDEKPAGQ